MGKKNVWEQDLTVSNADGCYLNEVIRPTSEGNELLISQSPGVGTETMLNMLVQLEESNQ